MVTDQVKIEKKERLSISFFSLNHTAEMDSKSSHVKTVQWYLNEVKETSGTIPKLNLCFGLFDYLVEHIRWVRLHPKLHLTALNKLIEFEIYFSRRENGRRNSSSSPSVLRSALSL